eukprot:gene21360-28298_t
MDGPQEAVGTFGGVGSDGSPEQGYCWVELDLERCPGAMGTVGGLGYDGAYGAMVLFFLSALDMMVTQELMGLLGGVGPDGAFGRYGNRVVAFGSDGASPRSYGTCWWRWIDGLHREPPVLGDMWLPLCAIQRKPWAMSTLIIAYREFKGLSRFSGPGIPTLAQAKESDRFSGPGIPTLAQLRATDPTPMSTPQPQGRTDHQVMGSLEAGGQRGGLGQEEGGPGKRAKVEKSVEIDRTGSGGGGREKGKVPFSLIKGTCRRRG